MLIFKDLFTGDEVLSDAFRTLDMTGAVAGFEGKKAEDIEYAIIKVPSSKVTPREDGEIDIGCGNAFSNPDAEAEEKPADENAPQPVIDLAYYFKLEQQNYDAKEFKAQFQDYCKRLKAKCEALDAQNENQILITRFKRNFPALRDFAAMVTREIGNCEFYTGRSMDPQGMLIVAKYEEGATSPDFYFYVDGLEIEKC
eukprot:GILI01008614.1.p2 GENE.GILI01008614.1~~GILI01008614.1.p2  ORF type:complete len:212 (-),score=68.00 GILI01008614.1:84-677(-)